MKYLDKINSPKDLKSIPREELGEVCKELRTYITCLLYTSPSPRD